MVSRRDEHVHVLLTSIQAFLIIETSPHCCVYPRNTTVSFEQYQEHFKSSKELLRNCRVIKDRRSNPKRAAVETELDMRKEARQD